MRTKRWATSRTSSTREKALNSLRRWRLRNKILFPNWGKQDSREESPKRVWSVCLGKELLVEIVSS